MGQLSLQPHLVVYTVYIRDRRCVLKTVIDLDPELTDAAAKVLGTTTKKDTVHAALAAAVAEAERRARRQERLVNSAGGPDLADPTVMSGAWA
jgi:Arc/MetJ family transcription regulator